MVVCLLLDLGLKAAFEFKGEAVLEDRDPLELPPADAALPDFCGKGVLLSLCTETKKPRHQPTAG